MNALSHFADALLIRLAWTSIQATVLIAILLLIVRLMPRLPAAMRCTLWWLVSLQLVLGLCWHAPLALPLLSPAISTANNISAGHASPAFAVEVPIPFATDNAPVPHHQASMADTAASSFAQWREWLPALWLAAMLAQLPLLARQWWRTRRLLRSAEPLVDEPMQALCAERARALGLRRCPPLYICAAITSPQVSGLRQPVILLPAVHVMTRAESAMAIAHELAHLRRGDLWLGWLPAIAGRLFFFHPLVRWALREFAFEREAACDAEVMRQTGTLPHAYAQLLLRLGVSHPMHAGLAGASPTFETLKRRLTMLQHFDPRSRRHLHGWLLVTLVAVAGVLPYRVTAASSQNEHTTTPATSAPAAMPMPPMAPMPPPPPAPPMNAPPVPAAPPAPMAPPPPPPPPPRDTGFSARHVDIETNPNTHDCDAANGIPFCGAKSLVLTRAVHEGQGLVLFDQGNVVIAGTNEDILAAKPLWHPDARVLWFRDDGKIYVVRSPSALRKADALIAQQAAQSRTSNARFEALQQLVAEQGQLLARKGEIASQEGKLVDDQSQLATLQASAPNSAKNQRMLEQLRTQRAGQRQKINALDGRAHALQERIRQQQANFHAPQQTPWDEITRLSIGLTKLANDTLADGSAQEVIQ